MAFSSRPRVPDAATASPVLQWLAFLALQFAATRASLAIDAAHAHVSPVWVPAGLMLAGLMVFARADRSRLDAWRFLTATATGALLANAAALLEGGMASAPVAWIVATSVALGNASSSLMVAWIFRRLGRRHPVGSTVDVLAFSGACLVAATASASLGVGAFVTYSLLPAPHAGHAWLGWWMGDVAGMLVVAPPLCLLAAWRSTPRAPRSWTRIALTVAVVGGAIALVRAAGSDGAHHDRLLAPLLVLAIALAAWRHGRAGAAWSLMAVSTSAVLAMLQGQGPFAPALVPGALVALDVFLVLCALVAWLVAATLAPRVPGDVAGAGSGRWAPAATLAGGIAVTVLAWHAVSSDTERQSAQRFDAMGADIRGRIAERMRNFELALRGARGLHVGSDVVTTVDWQRYVATLDLRTALPGVQALGYADRRAGESTPVRMIAPMDEANRRVVDVDLSAESRRREAIQRARDTGQTSITAPVRLLQDQGLPDQPGFLMVLPLYVNGSDPGTVAARRLRTLGYVYAPFRIRPMVDDLLRPADRELMTLDIRDAGLASATAGDGAAAPPMYASDDAAPDARARYRHETTWIAPLAFGGRTWVLDFRSRPAFEATVDHQKALLVLLAGGLVSLLLFAVMRALSVVEEDALALAGRMTREREQAEVRFRSLAGSAGDGIAVWSDDGLLSYSNDAFARLLGLPADEVAGRSILDLLPVPGIRTAEDWHVFMTAGDIPTTEHHLSRADGSTVPVEVSLGRWTLHGVTNHVGIVRDVTARHLADAMLRETQDDLNAVLDHLPAMVSSCTPDLRMRFYNREHQDWYGIDPALHPGLHMRQLIGEDAFRELEPAMHRALAGESVSFERRIVTHDRRERWAQIHYFPDRRHGHVQGMIRLVFDITPLKAAQHELQANLRVHDLIFNHAGVGLALLRDGVFERASHHLTELFGVPDGGLDGQPAETIFPDEASYVSLRDEARLEFMCGRTFDRETSLRHRDGSLLWCRLLARAVDPDDPAAGSIVIIQDFRDRRQREQLLERARMAAESASRLKAEFLANMSHEIRTPMNGIIGMTRLTLESALTEAQRENLEIVLDSAGSLMHLLNDILDFSKVEAGKLELEQAEFDLRERLWATAVPFATLARGKGLELVLDVAPDVPARVTGDSVRLMQVVSNLLSNAVKFTASGSVTCRVDARQEGGGCRLDVAVVDTGPGMSPEVQSRIFGSFVQADASVTRQHGGTGLGLAICSQIVTLMSGTIRVESAPGQGAAFHFSARFAQASPPPEVPAPVREHLQGQSVVVVSPLAPLRQALARQLAAAGARAVEFPSAAPAIAAADLARRVGAPFVGAIVDDVPDEPGLARLPHLVRLRAADRPLGQHDEAGLRKPPRPADLLAALCSALPEASGGPATTSLAPVPAPPRAARPLSVLLAEDHPVNQKLAQRLLERRGHRVTWARHGEEALRLSAAADFDVILMDIQMPVMDGITAMREIRAREAPSGRRTPIVALTAHALQGERERMLAQGMDEHLSKPLDPAALLRVVESFGARSDATPAGTHESAGAATDAAAGPPASAEREEPASPVLDVEAALEGTQGDAGLLGELAALLLDELPRLREALRAHVEASDWEAATRAAHRLKGAAGNVQALGTQALCLRLEAACEAADGDAARGVLARLDRELDHLAEALSALATESAS